MNCVESASTPVGHAVTSLPFSHAPQGGNTHVHDPHDFAICLKGREMWSGLMRMEYDASEQGEEAVVNYAQ